MITSKSHFVAIDARLPPAAGDASGCSAEAEITSHQLLLRAGYIRRVGSGIYAYLPLMWRVLQKITAVVREEMNRAGAQETLLPQLHPAELWQKSGR